VNAAAPLPACDTVEVDHRGAQTVVTARMRVDPDQEYLRGHFPGMPIYPGVFVIETLTQALARAFAPAGTEVELLRSVRFVAPLLGGDELTLEAVVRPEPDGLASVAAVGRRADGRVATRIAAQVRIGGGRDA
jgi:3-hydroxyacyl-[acyl-carrier-protein] dehydratase